MNDKNLTKGALQTESLPDSDVSQTNDGSPQVDSTPLSKAQKKLAFQERRKKFKEQAELNKKAREALQAARQKKTEEPQAKLPAPSDSREKAIEIRREKAKDEAESNRLMRIEALEKAKLESPQRANDRVLARAETRAIAELDLDDQYVKPLKATPAPARPKWSAFLLIGIPLLISSIYYFFIASNQYISTAKFTITSQSSSSSSKSGGLGSLMGGSSSDPATIALQFIVQDYVASPQMLADLEPYLDIRKIYSHPSADKWARLDPSVPQEKLLDYWKSMVTVHFDMMTFVSEVNVRAFTPQDAKDVAHHVLMLSEKLVRKLSERSRIDSLKIAKDEVDASYKRLGSARDALETFSKKHEQLTPDAFISTQGEVQAKLIAALASYRTDLNSLRASKLDESSPGIQRLKNMIAAAEEQLAREKQSSTQTQGGSSPVEIANTLSKLKLESDYASQAYLSARSFLENVQLQSVSQACYLEAYVQPQLAQFSLYPNRIYSVLLTLLISTGVWIIINLIFGAMRHKR